MDIDAVALLGADTTPHSVGSRLCLAAVNTVVWRRGPAPQEYLRSYGDLVTLVEDAGWVADSGALRAAADRHPRIAGRELAKARELRDQLLATFSAVATGCPPPADALDDIQAIGGEAFGRLRLDRSGTRYRLAWPDVTLDLPVLQVAASAMLLLASSDLDRVKQCPGPTCGWLFIDATRNRSRRWCDPAECGNRSRVQAHYDRHKGASMVQ